MIPLTIEEIRRAAEQLANRHNDTTGCAALMQAEIKAAILPVMERYKATLDGYAAAEQAARDLLDDMLMAAPHLFIKPRSIAVDGVRCGYKREPDTLDWADDAEVIARIKALRPELAALLIRTQESLVIDALAGLEPAERAVLGLRTITGADNRYITIGDSDVEKLAKIVIVDAARRQGEDEKPAKPAGRAKVKAEAV
jgi:hypothetical protein